MTQPRRIRYYAPQPPVLDEDRAPITQHTPRLPSIVLLILCAICREYMLEGSHAAGFCTRCGTKHPLAA